MKVLLLVALLSQLTRGTNVFQTVFEWKALDYAFPTLQDKVRALLTNRFIPENNLPVGIEVWNDKLFVTVPRWRQGIPSTLNYIPLNQGTPKSPVLIPYPSWKSNEAANCETGLTTAYRIKVDQCDRLWVLDTGTFGIDETTTNPCPYALNVFDLHTNTRLRRYELRKEDIKPSTFIANIAIDMRKSCDDTFAYMSDELGYGLIAYSWDLNKSWRFEHSYFMPDPLAGDFNIGGLNFQWGEEGIFGMSLSPVQDDGFRILYFSPLASNREFAVSTKILRDETKVEESYHDFAPLEDRGPNSHTTARVMDDNGVQFFNLIDRNAVGCWNSKLPYHPNNLGVVDRDDVEMIFPCDVKVDRNGYVWLMSDRMPNFLLSNLNYSDVNFRVFFAPIDRLIHGTPCFVDNNYGYGKDLTGGVHPILGIYGNQHPGVYGSGQPPVWIPNVNKVNGKIPTVWTTNNQQPTVWTTNKQLPAGWTPNNQQPPGWNINHQQPGAGWPKDNLLPPGLAGKGLIPPTSPGNNLPNAGWPNDNLLPPGLAGKGLNSPTSPGNNLPNAGWPNDNLLPPGLVGKGLPPNTSPPYVFYNGQVWQGVGNGPLNTKVPSTIYNGQTGPSLFIAKTGN